MSAMSVVPCCHIVPPYLLEALARHPDEHVATCARRSLDRDASLRGLRSPAPRHTDSPPDHPVEHEAGAPSPNADDGTHPERTVADAHGQETTPGTTVRTEGQAATGDAAADEAYDGLGATWDLYRQVYGRDSLDDHGLPLLGTVHYGEDYDNAFWDGSQMVFGDGDGTVFNRFTIAVDVIGHELTHGVTQYTANLTYSGQSGALNESVSDVFGIMIKQRVLGQDSATSDWLIGEDIVGPELQPALRSMKDPGHANPHDDQPATMDGYVVGGDVHTNSGIPNHAFYVVATTYGGNAWEAPGTIWYHTLLDRSLPHNASFATFARVTLRQASDLYGPQSKELDAVKAGWHAVKVKAKLAGKPASS